MFFYNYVDTQYLNNARAKARQIKPRAKLNEDGSYTVHGGSDYNVSFHLDSFNSLGADCNCIAGVNGKPCYHTESVLPLYIQWNKEKGLQTPEMWTPVPKDSLEVRIAGKVVGK